MVIGDHDNSNDNDKDNDDYCDDDDDDDDYLPWSDAGDENWEKDQSWKDDFGPRGHFWTAEIPVKEGCKEKCLMSGLLPNQRCKKFTNYESDINTYSL